MEKDRIDRMCAMEIYRYLRSIGYGRRDAHRNIKAQLSSWPLIYRLVVKTPAGDVDLNEFEK